MSMVFPASSGEKCPRDDCGSTRVERLGTQADFGKLNVDSPVRTLWLCLACERPFKVVRPGGVHVGARAERGEHVSLPLGVHRVDDSVRVTARRAS